MAPLLASLQSLAKQRRADEEAALLLFAEAVNHPEMLEFVAIARLFQSSRRHALTLDNMQAAYLGRYYWHTAPRMTLPCLIVLMLL